MLPQARLVAKLKSLEAVTALIGQSVWPIIAPQGTAYPHLVYQVLSDDPVNSAGGTTPTSNMKIRIAALALVSGGQSAYTAAWALASAVRGDCDPAAPTGISGWQDDQGSVWHLEDCFDEMGTITAGTDAFDAYVANLVFNVWYTVDQPKV